MIVRHNNVSAKRMIHLDIEQVSVAHEVVPPNSTLLANHTTHPVLGHLREEGIPLSGERTGLGLRNFIEAKNCEIFNSGENIFSVKTHLT